MTDAARGARKRAGELRVYLGAAPGVGKTFAMLGEALRRLERGADVVVAVVETHDRRHTAALLEGIETVPRRQLEHRGAVFEEMDVDAVLQRKPDVALVDELAHTNVPGSRHEKRWQDVEELLAAGIDVITTVNIQHLESLNDVVATITGVRQRETVPDQVVRAAEQIELVDMSPQALRRRMAHGNVYTAEKVDAALSSYFRLGNLTALRELALLWTADRVDDALDRYRVAQGIEQSWPARERVVVASGGSPDTDVLIRRGARIAERTSGGELLVLHVIRGDGLGRSRPADLARQQDLAETLGGSWHTVVGDDVPRAVLDFAHGVNATQLVVGAGTRGRLSRLVTRGTAAAVIDGSGDVDVQVVTLRSPESGQRRPRSGTPLGRRRTAAAWALAVLGPPLLTAALMAVDDVALPTVLMLFLSLSVVVALVGGLWPALFTSVASGLIANYVFTPPLRTLTIAEPDNAIALAVLVGVAAAMSLVVDLAARRTQTAARANATAETLTALAATVIRSTDTVGAVLEHLVTTFGLTRAAIERRGQHGWVTEREVLGAGVTAPDPPATRTMLPIREHLRIAVEGPALSAGDLRTLTVVGLQADAALERDALRAEARAGRLERERAATRTALLAAVSHDLRTPLASIRAGISSLASTDLDLDAADREVLLRDVATSAETLQRLIDNLLDMSRLDAGAVGLRPVVVAVEDVVALGLAGLPRGASLVVDVPEDLPLIEVDAGLVERALANLVENALRHGSSSEPVRVTAGAVAGEVVIRVIDHGPGIPDDRKDAVFAAFQRGGDTESSQGVGLGLAVAKGFVEANGGTLEAEDTPGGGLTMTLRFPTADG